MKSAIVTGATGFIGTHLCSELLKNNIKVTGLARKDSGNIKRLQDVNLVWCGMDDYDSFEGEKADTFYHLAWEGATGIGRDDEELQVKNITRTMKALKAAKRSGCRRFVALGTVYENLVPQILMESRHRKPDFYLLSKQSSHHICTKLAEKLGIEFVWATIFQPIGRYIKKEQVMTYAIASLLSGEPPEFGPAMEPYDITAVEDIAYGLRLLGECRLTRKEYYIGSDSPMLMKEYLKRARKVLGVDTELKIGARADDGLRFSYDWYDISPIKKDTGYSIHVGFEQAVVNVAEWVKSGGLI
ncbi:NAD(P)-dependent oxidoreductase [Lachnospiraceae bacterium MD308]|nr:NAD(P)-dependent oxidoreductase [Lachnospiraceae bacterium MD308]MCI8579241.1 NAD(P)-dependent oxidoreductase [Dorea sp.]